MMLSYAVLVYVFGYLCSQAAVIFYVLVFIGVCFNGDFLVCWLYHTLMFTF